MGTIFFYHHNNNIIINIYIALFLWSNSKCCVTPIYMKEIIIKTIDEYIYIYTP